MSIEDIEVAVNASQPLNFSRHPLEAPELTLQQRFYPMGFPVDVRTNSSLILDLFRFAWRHGTPRYRTAPIAVDVHLVDSDEEECPPTPSFRMMLPVMLSVANAENYSVLDTERGTTQVVVSMAALRHPLYINYFFIESAAACHIVTRYAAPVHAGCVEWNGKGILLCGDSGAGKSTLSYACARAGFGYISDDATFLLRNGEDRVAIGDSHKVRLRPESVRFFPEMEGIGITPRAAGKPSVEIPTGDDIVGLEETRVDLLVFLNRRSGKQELLPYSSDVAREFMRQVIFGLPDQQEWQYRKIDALLQAPVYELHYQDLDWAIARLKLLAQDGR